MNDRDPIERDDDLRARLRCVDPAASLPPVDAAAVARLVQAATHPAAHLAAHPAAHPAAQRVATGRWPQLVAAAAVVVAGGVGLWSVTGRDDTGPVGATDPVPTSVAPDASAAATPPVAPDGRDEPTLLSAPAALSTKCMVPNAEVLRRQELAFRGTVTGVDGLTVDLTTAEVYAGDVAAAVRVQAPSAEMSMLLGAVQFEVGKTYLVSATDGQVTLCGFSAEATPDLTALYAEAYGG